MSLCLVVDNNNIVSAELTPVKDCTGYIALSASEYQSLVDVPLNFDSELFNTTLGWILVTFIVGHSTGRIVKYLGKR